MRFFAFSARNRKEILRDPLSLIFGIGFPVILILMVSLMTQNIKEMPAEVFGLDHFAPGMAVFGLSFLSLFIAILMSNDRKSSFLTRMFASPLTGLDYIAGYSLPLIPIAIAQSVVCFATALLFGMTASLNILLALLVLVPVALLYISIGLLMGSTLTSSQVGGVSPILVNLAVWLSGTWFSLEMIGGAFETICYALPFAHAVDAVSAALTGDYGNILPHLWWVIGYAAVLFAAAVYSFRRKMKNGII